MFHMLYQGEPDSLDKSFDDINIPLFYCHSDIDKSFNDINIPLFYCPNDIDDTQQKEIANKSSNNTSEQTNISENKIKYFKIIKEEKRRRKKRIGRKRARDYQIVENSEKCHSKYAYDNIIRKIQVDFLNFLVSFINEILINLGIKKKFFKIKYKNKKDVKKENVANLKSKEIGQILRQNLSTKYRKKYKDDKEKNNKLYLEVIKYDSIKKILSEKYINIFRNLYYKNKRDLNDYGLNIKLSNKIKTYQDLLDKNSNESKYVEKINKVVEKYYLPQKLFIHN